MKHASYVVLVLAIITAMPVFGTGLGEPEISFGAARILYPQSVSSIPVLALIDAYPSEYSGEFFTDHPQALARLLSREIDLLATGFSVGLSRYESTGDIIHLVTPVWGVSALMTAREISDINEISGGVVYAPFQGSPIDIYLRAAIEEADLTDEVAIAYAPFPQAAALVIQGRADAAVLVEPLASRLELQGQAYRLENLHDGWARISGGEPRSPQVSLFAVAGSRFAGAGPVRLLETRLRAIVDQIVASPGEYAQRYGEALGFPAEIVEMAILNTYFEVPDNNEARDVIAHYARIMGLEIPDARFFAAIE